MNRLCDESDPSPHPLSKRDLRIKKRKKRKTSPDFGIPCIHILVFSFRHLEIALKRKSSRFALVTMYTEGDK